MSPSRLIVALVIVGAVAYLALHLTSSKAGAEAQFADVGTEWEKPAPSPHPMKLTSSAQCKECHPGVYDEWYASHHRLAYVNEDVQKLSKGFTGSGVDCLPCHLSRPIADTGYDGRPLERATRREEGVDCFTCHFWTEGQVMLATGPLGSSAKSAPCNPAVSPAVQQMGVCTPCHNQHKVYSDWKETRFALKGDDFRDCNDCHMPIVERTLMDGSKKKGRSHLYPAAHDLAMLQSAATVTASKLASGPGDSKVLRIQVANTGAGHYFPADERHRAVDLRLILKDSDGEAHSVRIERYRNPYRDEFGAVNPYPNLDSKHEFTREIGLLGQLDISGERIPAKHQPQREVYYPASTQIAAGEARRYRITLPSGAESATIQLWYRTNPFQSDADAKLIHESTIEL